MKLVKLTLIACFLFCLGSPAVLACRFNVRDVGFVDLGKQPYGFFCYLDNSTNQQITEDFKEIANAELPQTNITARTINVEQTPDHPVMQYLPAETKTFPVFVLVSPDRRSITIDSIEKGDGFKDSLQKAFGIIVASPMRTTIIEKTIDTFGVVLIVEGTDAPENERAAIAAQAAINKITSQMNSLPKRIAKPPMLLKMSRQQQEQEKMLLWSMGIDTENNTQPQAVILYGRGRRMGSVLSGKLLTEEMLTKFLYVIGADCECGLDRSWMQGTMMPARWGDGQLKKLAKLLGFDTEHPMIKIEMSQIIRKGSQSGKKPVSLDSIGGFGYQEIEIKFDNPPAVTEPEQKDGSDVTSNKQIQEQFPLHDQIADNQAKADVPAEPKTDEDEFKLRSPLYIIGISGIFILVIGAYFMISGAGEKT